MSDDLDLHGYTAAEALERFVQHYNIRVNRRQFGRWQIIHGYGSTGAGGTIRAKLRAFLDRHSDKLRFEAGDYMAIPVGPGSIPNCACRISASDWRWRSSIIVRPGGRKRRSSGSLSAR
ncbi:MAG: Smr/MutS family protein, partial [Verrucomicrobiota bacterium]